MKRFGMVGLLSVGLLLGYGTTLTAADAPNPPLPATYEGLIKELIASIDGLSQLLEGIKDENGVTAAKEKLTEILRRQSQIGQALDKMEGTPDEDEKLKEKYDATMVASMKKLAAQRERLNGVPGFTKVLNEIQAQVQGQK